MATPMVASIGPTLASAVMPITSPLQGMGNGNSSGMTNLNINLGGLGSGGNSNNTGYGNVTSPSYMGSGNGNGRRDEHNPFEKLGVLSSSNGII
ncbi:unnamed protein product [Ambrosiozyma monospora]|nr:unnamed protein product [Ambrosiozyma monospora]